MPTRNGYKQVEIITKIYPDRKDFWVVEHDGQSRIVAGNPADGKWHGPYRTQQEAEAALLGMWNPARVQK